MCLYYSLGKKESSFKHEYTWDKNCSRLISLLLNKICCLVIHCIYNRVTGLTFNVFTLGNKEKIDVLLKIMYLVTLSFCLTPASILCSADPRTGSLLLIFCLVRYLTFASHQLPKNESKRQVTCRQSMC